MPLFGQIVVGPAGCGKSAFCAAASTVFETNLRRKIRVINLDPGADRIVYERNCDADIRTLTNVDEVMQSQHLGPNGALMYSMELLCNNLNWFNENIEAVDSDYYIFDCPGQVELFVHSGSMQKIIKYLIDTFDFRLCVVFLVDCQFATDIMKFTSSVLCAFSCMAHFELPHFNVISKIDKLDENEKKFLYKILSSIDSSSLTEMLEDPSYKSYMSNLTPFKLYEEMHSAFILKLANVLDQYDYVSFSLISAKKSKTIMNLLTSIDLVLQYDEFREVRERDTDANEEGNAGEMQI
ncbi:MAG: GPN-loop GTPase 3 [Marteilia pararefringens]